MSQMTPEHRPPSDLPVTIVERICYIKETMIVMLRGVMLHLHQNIRFHFLETLHDIVFAASKVIMQAHIFGKQQSYICLCSGMAGRPHLSSAPYAGQLKDRVVPPRTSGSHCAEHGTAQRAGLLGGGNLELAAGHIRIDLHQQLVLLGKPHKPPVLSPARHWLQRPPRSHGCHRPWLRSGRGRFLRPWSLGYAQQQAVRSTSTKTLRLPFHQSSASRPLSQVQTGGLLLQQLVNINASLLSFTFIRRRNAVLDKPGKVIPTQDCPAS